MQAGLGPLAASGVAIVSAGVIAVTPVAPPLPDRVVPAPAVELAAADSDWSVIFDKAGLGAAALAKSYFDAPLPILQQIIANQISYLGQLPDIAAIAEQIVVNFARAITTPAAPTTDTLDAQHKFLYEALPFITSLPLVDLFVQISPTGQQLLDFSTSQLSGVLLGLVGPAIGPAVILGANLQSIISDLSAATPDPGRALTTLLNTPAQMADAFLNGGVHVDLTELAEALGPSIGVSFPDGTKLGIAFGGLFSPGGSIFNALDMDYERDVLGLPIIRVNLANGTGPGFIGSLIEMNKAIARAIGWSGSGSPLAPSGSSSQRSGLAAADEVPRSVLGSRVTSLSASIRNVDVDNGVRKKVSADTMVSADDESATVGDAVEVSVVADGAADGPGTEGAAADGTDAVDKPAKGVRSGAAVTGESTTGPTGGRHRADAQRVAFGSSNSAGADSGASPSRGMGKHAQSARSDRAAAKSDRAATKSDRAAAKSDRAASSTKSEKAGGTE